jgi:hypothetical protein
MSDTPDVDHDREDPAALDQTLEDAEGGLEGSVLDVADDPGIAPI